MSGCLLLLGPVSTALAGDPRAGQRKAQPCIACHGADGVATLPNAPHLAGQPALYTAEQLRQFRSGKRPSEVMQVIAKPLSDADIDDLAAWYESLRIEVRPPLSGGAATPSAVASRGQSLRCSIC